MEAKANLFDFLGNNPVGNIDSFGEVFQPVGYSFSRYYPLFGKKNMYH